MSTPTAPVAITAGSSLPAGCGGKARGLQAIARAGLPFPPAWSVLPEAGRGEAGSSWQVLRRLARRQREVVRMGGSGVCRVAVESRAASRELLTPAAAAAIATGVKTLEAALGCPLDVEWAWCDGEATFLQARPQTRSLRDELQPGETWTRANAREVLPELPSALTRSTITRVVDSVLRELLRRHGIRVDASIPLATYICGRPVFNERMFGTSEALGCSPGWTMTSRYRPASSRTW